MSFGNVLTIMLVVFLAAMVCYLTIKKSQRDQRRGEQLWLEFCRFKGWDPRTRNEVRRRMFATWLQAAKGIILERE